MEAARAAAGHLLGGPHEIVYGAIMTTLMFTLTFTSCVDGGDPVPTALAGMLASPPST
jgi:hypothetical protein